MHPIAIFLLCIFVLLSIGLAYYCSKNDSHSKVLELFDGNMEEIEPEYDDYAEHPDDEYDEEELKEMLGQNMKFNIIFTVGDVNEDEEDGEEYDDEEEDEGADADDDDDDGADDDDDDDGADDVDVMLTMVQVGMIMAMMMSQ